METFRVEPFTLRTHVVLWDSADTQYPLKPPGGFLQESNLRPQNLLAGAD